MTEPVPAPDVPTGNTYDKYSSSNPIEQRLMDGFFTALDASLPDGRPRRVLEVGVGEGEIARRIGTRWPGVPVAGVDLVDEELTATWRERGVVGSFADITRLPFPPRTFDLVLAIEVLEHVPDPEHAVAELARVASGHVVLSVPREPVWRIANMARGKYIGALGNTPGHIQHWSARRFAALVAQHLQVDAVRRPLPWTMVAAHRE